MRTGNTALRILVPLCIGVAAMGGLAVFGMMKAKDRARANLERERVLDQIDADKAKFVDEITNTDDPEKQRAAARKYGDSAMGKFENLAAMNQDEVQKKCMTIVTEEMKTTRKATAEFEEASFDLRSAEVLNFKKKPTDAELDKSIALVRKYGSSAKELMVAMKALKVDAQRRIEALNDRTGKAKSSWMALPTATTRRWSPGPRSSTRTRKAPRR